MGKPDSIRAFQAGALSVVALSAFCVLACADGLDDSIGPGMVKKRVGSSYMVVPKGTLVKKSGDVRVLEDPLEYAGRRFQEIDIALRAIEGRIEQAKAEISKMRESVKAI